MNQLSKDIFRFRESAGDGAFSVAIAGDVCPGPFGAAVAAPFAAIAPFVSGAACRIVQFETPLVRALSPIPKTGPNLATPPEAAAQLRGVFDVALLANNHIGDQGPGGVLSTIRELREAGLATVGAGANLAEAEAPLEIDCGSARVSLFNFAEHEFGIAAPDCPGAAPIRERESLRAVAAASRAGNLPIVVLHGGHEHFPFPSPRLRDLCRAFVDAGAKLVVNCHQHCPAGLEWFAGAPILYGLGNLWFPPDARPSSRNRPALWRFGLVAKVLFDSEGPYAIDLLPVRGDERGPVPLKDSERDAVLEHVRRLSAPIADDARLAALFEAWSAESGRKYLRAAAVDLPPEWLATEEPRDWERVAPSDPHPFLEMRNVFMCESHSDIVRMYLRMVVEGRLDSSLHLQPAIAAAQNPVYSLAGQPLPPVPQDTDARAKVLAFFEENVFGRVPEAARHPALRFEEIAPASPAMNGAAVRRRVAVHFAGPGGKGIIEILAFVPAAATAEKPASAALLLCNRDPAINMDPERKKRTQFWDAERIVASGFAAVAIHVGSVVPDEADGFDGYLQSLFLRPGEKKTPDSWGTLAAWAWTGSRVMDWIETEPLIDAQRVMVAGHSRGGKTALWCAATDTRFAMAVSNCSGCGGAKLSRVWLPRSEHIEQLVHSFPHWFCGNFAQWAGKEKELPFDQHQLLALIAPRALYVSSASLDSWAGQPGEFLAAKLASPAWRASGQSGIPDDAEFPAPDSPLFGGGIAYHIHTGPHTITSADWVSWLAFATRIWAG